MGTKKMKNVLGLKKRIEKEKAKHKQKEMEKKVKAFNEDYEKVVEKHEIALTPVLQYSPNGVFARLQPRDVSEQLKKKKEEDQKN